MIFLKLGGSLITEKSKPETARIAVIQRLTKEIATFVQTQRSTRLLANLGGSLSKTNAVVIITPSIGSCHAWLAVSITGRSGMFSAPSVTHLK